MIFYIWILFERVLSKSSANVTTSLLTSFFSPLLKAAFLSCYINVFMSRVDSIAMNTPDYERKIPSSARESPCRLPRIPCEDIELYRRLFCFDQHKS